MPPPRRAVQVQWKMNHPSLSLFGMSTESVSQAVIRTTPAITDPRELDTIITSSLRSLFGDCQPHSCSVKECRPCSDRPTQGHESYEAIIECPESSMEHVRAALTFSSTPSYLEGSIYRLDFIQSK